jgi:DNA-binding MarR family transcriptional regulator
MVGGEEASGERPARLGVALQQAWDGYQRELDRELAAAGFADRGFPDGRVLRLCASAKADVTISQIGRELGITRQGASKIVASLRDRGYVALSPSPTDRREKIVTLTPRAVRFLAAQRQAASRIEARIRSELGPDAVDGLYGLLDALDALGEGLRTGASQPRSDIARTQDDSSTGP